MYLILEWIFIEHILRDKNGDINISESSEKLLVNELMFSLGLKG